MVVPDVGQVVGIGVPVSVITGILITMVNAYLSTRKDKREDRTSRVKNDSDIVDNAKKVVDLVHAETERMDKRIQGLIDRNSQLEKKVRQQDDQINRQDDIIARQERQIEWLTKDLEAAHSRISDIEEKP